VAKTQKVRTIERWEHQSVVEENAQRVKAHPELMRKRSALVEHPFGTIKHSFQMGHFSMRGRPQCQGEFSLMTRTYRTYNFKRVLNVMGLAKLMSYCQWKQG